MKYTSAQANKLLKQLQEERYLLLTSERQSSTFVAATTEDPETARPAYSYSETRDQLVLLEQRIRQVKHAINTFNLTHVVDGFDMTVDQLLIYIPQLTERKEKLRKMAAVLPKTRLATSGRSNIIEYEYANYDIDVVRKDFDSVSSELARAQLALDHLNATDTMDIDF